MVLGAVARRGVFINLGLRDGSRTWLDLGVLFGVCAVERFFRIGLTGVFTGVLILFLVRMDLKTSSGRTELRNSSRCAKCS